jgi:Domain of unknown function (DUF4397)
MKKNIRKIYFSMIVGSVALLLNACGNSATFDAVTPVTDGAKVKFVHAVQGGPAIVVFANGKKWSAILNSISNGPDSLVYGGIFPQTDYAILPAGANNFEIKTPASANPASAAVAASSLTFESGKYYTVIAADTLPSPRLVTITDDRDAIKNDRKTYVRFVNLLTGGSATGYEFVLRRKGVSTTLTSIKYGELGTTLEIDPAIVGNSINDSLFIRIPGATTNLTALNLTGSTTTNLTPNRLRTFILRGKLSSFGVSTIINN